MNPLNVFAVADRLVDEFCVLRPVDALTWGLVGFEPAWGDWSPAAWDRLEAVMRRAVGDTEALPPSEDRWEVVGRRVLREYAGAWLDKIEHHEHLRDLNNIASPVQDLRSVFEVLDKNTAADWAIIARLLASSHEPVSGYIACLEQGRSMGLTAARRQVEACIQQLEASAAADSPYDTMLDEYDAVVGDPDLRAALVAGISGAKEASATLGTYLSETYLADAVEADGVGRQRYLRLVEPFLGSSIDPEATYRWGWEEIDRWWARAEQIAHVIKPGSTVADVIEFLKSDPSRAAQSVEEFVRLMKERQAQALEELSGTHFDVPEEIRTVEVQIEAAGGALGAHYHGPSEDFSRPGSVWYSLGSNTTVPLFSEISTAYHEGFPGHHLQTGIQVGLTDRLTRLHRTLAWRSGYGEGWALYAERFMDELGYFEKPEYELGLVAAQLLRSCRIVIDIGMHLDLPIESNIVAGGRWSYEKAVALLRSHAFLDRDYAESEVTRYLGWPGQAISYKLGEKAILDLRDEAARGESFDLKEFHSLVLGSGPVGLDHLREIVRAGL